MSELSRDDMRAELTEELGREPAYRIDLFVRNTALGVEVLQRAAKAEGLTVLADATTLERLKRRQVLAVVYYTDSLRAAELAAFLARVSAEDTKYTPRVCDALHVTPAGRADELELKAILGTDVGLFKRPSVERTKPSGAGKPLSAGTLDSVEKMLTNPPAKTGERSALLMTWQTSHPTILRTPPGASAELKQFLSMRARKPNAVPTIIVIRPVG
jgi:hypothetical protein